MKKNKFIWKESVSLKNLDLLNYTLNKNYVFGENLELNRDLIKDISLSEINDILNTYSTNPILDFEIHSFPRRIFIAKKIISIFEKKGFDKIIGIGRDSRLIYGLCDEKIGSSKEGGYLIENPNSPIEDQYSIVCSKMFYDNHLLDYAKHISKVYGEDKILLYDVGELGSQLIFFKRLFENYEIECKTFIISPNKKVSEKYHDFVIGTSTQITMDYHPIKPFKKLNLVEIDKRIFEYENLKKRIEITEGINYLFDQYICKNLDYDRLINEIEKL